MLTTLKQQEYIQDRNKMIPWLNNSHYVFIKQTQLTNNRLLLKQASSDATTTQLPEITMQCRRYFTLSLLANYCDADDEILSNQ